MDAHCPGKENYNNKFDILNFYSLKYRNFIGRLFIEKLYRHGNVIYECMGRNSTSSDNKW
jgi:hypothetical protein